MKIYLTILIIFLFQADSINETNNIQITIKNKEIYFIEVEDNEIYKDSIDKEQSFNIVEIEFKNNSNDKMLLFINQEEISFYSGNFNDYKHYFAYGDFIETEESKMPETKNVLSTFLKYPEGLYNIENYKLSLRKMRYENLNLSDREMRAFEIFERYSFYLGAKETKAVYFHVSLPIVKESNPEILQNVFSFTKLKEGWDFKFMYEANGKNIYNDLPDFVKEELRNNKIEVFDGKIVSNAVKLKKR